MKAKAKAKMISALAMVLEYCKGQPFSEPLKIRIEEELSEVLNTKTE